MSITPIFNTTSTLPYDLETITSLNQAALILKSEGLVAFPTETVYGLGASALSTKAVQSIYLTKGRPSDNPLIVHISNLTMLYKLIPGGKKSIPELYLPLIKRFWPGPLSLIFPLNSSNSNLSTPPPEWIVSPLVTAQLPSLAIRMPSHPLALALISISNLPLAAPSANLSSRPSPTTAQHVFEDLGKGRGLKGILNGGECGIGVESTVIDYIFNLKKGRGEIRILRAGGITREELELCLRENRFGDDGEEGRVQVYQKDFNSVELEEKPTTPGMKYKHYSPKNCKVILVQPSTSNSTSTSNSLIDLIQLQLHLLPSLSSASSSSPSIPKRKRKRRIGLMLTIETLSLLKPITSIPLSNFSNIITLPLPLTKNKLSGGEEEEEEIELELINYNMGNQFKPIEFAQRLFAGLRYFDSLPLSSTSTSTTTTTTTTTSTTTLIEKEEEIKGVDLILIESIEEKGVGLAVMERIRKATGTNGIGGGNGMGEEFFV